MCLRTGLLIDDVGLVGKPTSVEGLWYLSNSLLKMLAVTSHRPGLIAFQRVRAFGNVSCGYFTKRITQTLVDCVPTCVKTADFQQNIQAAQFRESVIGSQLARHFGFLFQPNPFPSNKTYSKTCDFGLIDPVNSVAWRVEEQSCFHLEDLMLGEFSFELFTHTASGRREGKLLYSDATHFAYNAPLVETLFLFDWSLLKPLLIELYQSDMLRVLTFNNKTWKHDSNPVTLCLADCQTILTELIDSTSVFTYDELNIHSISKTYEKNSDN